MEKLKHFYVAICFVICVFEAHAQVTDSVRIRENLQLIRSNIPILIDSLHLKPAKGFYTQFNDADSPYFYVYVSSKERIEKATPGPFYYFENDAQAARKRADSMMKYGYDVMVYKTVGTSASVIQKHLLEYDGRSISFIMIHEAMHLHLVFDHFQVNYEYEEAIADVVANTYLHYCSDGTGLKRFIRCNEKVYKTINRCLKGAISKEKAQRKIYRVTNRIGTLFQQERYQYEVNNAYLLRFRDYTQNYFELKKRFAQGKNLHDGLYLALSQYCKHSCKIHPVQK